MFFSSLAQFSYKYTQMKVTTHTLLYVKKVNILLLASKQRLDPDP
jgi:hypothetical protein